MPKPLQQQTVVITGASSGIGRETALLLAEKGASVVLAARNEVSLRDLAQQIEKLDAQARVVQTDVSQWSEVQRLAKEAADWHGSIDTWVNNAAISEYGTVEQTPISEIERVIQVTLMGQIYGMKAALPYLKRQRQGTLINVASVLADVPVPLQAPYVAAKHGIRGFTDALRLELEHEESKINVTLVLPSSINTPFFRHARSHLYVEPKPIPPYYHPRVVAEAIVFAAEHRRREIIVGGAGKLLQVGRRLTPRLVELYMLHNGRVFKQQQTDQPDSGEDTLFDPLHRIEPSLGEFNYKLKSSSAYTRLFEFHPLWKRAALGVAALGAVALLAGRANAQH